MINLLTPEDKFELGRERFRRFLAVAGFLLALVLLGGVILLLPSYFFLVLERRELLREAELGRAHPVLGEIGELERALKDFNTKLTLYDARALGIRPVAPLLEDILKVSPPTVSLRNLTYEEASRTNPERVLLQGFASRRDDFLSFVNKLEGLSAFSKVNSPVSNLLKEADLEFSLILEVKQP